MKYTNPRSAEQLMRDNLLVKHWAGSHAYGTNITTSDEDYRGIFCADPVNILTPFFPVRESTDVTEEDTKLYELAHFMKLCLDCNPNIIETLWVSDDDIVASSDAYEHLRNHRVDLLSSKVAFTFSGYALSQLKRIRGHNKWINNPQPEQPPLPHEYLSVVQWMRKDKNLKPNIADFRDQHRLVPYGHNIYGVHYDPTRQLWDDHGNLNNLIEEGDRHKYQDPIMVIKWNKEEYKLAKERHALYWTWKKNRNKTRGALEEDFGYDTKHAMHLVRLLRMGVEILRDHEVVVKRPDAEELLAIRNGAWSYEELVKYAEDMDEQVRNVWYKNTSLQKNPNVKLAANLLMETQELMWGDEYG